MSKHTPELFVELVRCIQIADRCLSAYADHCDEVNGSAKSEALKKIRQIRIVAEKEILKGA